jgi:hypothetical protein
MILENKSIFLTDNNGKDHEAKADLEYDMNICSLVVVSVDDKDGQLSYQESDILEQLKDDIISESAQEIEQNIYTTIENRIDEKHDLHKDISSNHYTKYINKALDDNEPEIYHELNQHGISNDDVYNVSLLYFHDVISNGNKGEWEHLHFDHCSELGDLTTLSLEKLIENKEKYVEEFNSTRNDSLLHAKALFAKTQQALNPETFVSRKIKTKDAEAIPIKASKLR